MSSGSPESFWERGSSRSNRYAPDNNRDERATNLEICHFASHYLYKMLTAGFNLLN